MAKVSSKPAGKQAIKAGPSGKMNKGDKVGTQKPGVSSVEDTNAGGKFAKGGPSGKMAGFSPVAAQKAGRSSVK